MRDRPDDILPVVKRLLAIIQKYWADPAKV